MYAILNYRGEQHRVEEGDTICLGDLDLEKGSSIEFKDVLYLSAKDHSHVGTPYLEGAKIFGEVLGSKKAKKIMVFTYKRRKSSSRKMGHRQKYSLVKINKIEF